MDTYNDPSSGLTDLVQKTMAELDAEWNDAVLYVPYQNEQVLLYEYAECVAVRALLRIHGLPFKLEQMPNAEFMSPTRRVPFLRLGKLLIAEFSPIVEFIGKKGLKLASTLADTEKADLQAHLSLIEDILRNAELYLSWKDNETYKQVTSLRYGSVYLWPLYLWLPYLKRRESLHYLKVVGWSSKSMEDVVQQCEKCFHALSVKLGQKRYFMGDNPTELDALAFGHFFTILTTELPDMRIANALKRCDNLVRFSSRFDEEFFGPSSVS
ncbi:outer mitochondrial membrane transport complex protein domain-containing protein [Ditylenchus destructor]|uniref:Outer mitochondrial membrane transport complex protein domain-containing protein n=1 Tax=Ditylenchus destructor TaxID=166010 RepID=A0AAD4NBM3_9BILA|nr:outer mitochondrial membrane transport complex protein domain-containing protein [Ditylenchus destructor]